jgi:hypothetical protein
LLVVVCGFCSEGVSVVQLSVTIIQNEMAGIDHDRGEGELLTVENESFLVNIVLVLDEGCIPLEILDSCI